MRIVFLGAPGSGKGTQAKLVSQRLSVPAVSTGDMLRVAVRAGTPLGMKARAVMAQGELVPDDLMISLIKEHIAAADAHNRKGFVLDGYPRTIPQAESFEKLLAEDGAAVDAVVNFNVPDPVLIERLSGRADVERRADDRPETVRERLRVYHEKTEPLINYYRGKGLLVSVDGVGEIAEVAKRIERGLLAKARQGAA
ncbi:MAG TPA: adenylate kinase [Thermoanaerobaculia bacterium]|nr:adenylate kinase [Thermoanaerobaculia bacterium]